MNVVNKIKYYTCYFALRHSCRQSASYRT